ncbi:MAG: sodium:proton antiporter [Eubacterium sp.]|nr:sodium:proton antiporter [Eubacterium sp.]
MRPLYENFPFFCVFIALIGGILTTLIHDGRKARRLTMAILTVCAVLCGVLCAATAARGESITYTMGAFPAPWGNELRSGPAESLLACVFCLVMLFSLLGAGEDLKEDILPEKQNFYYIMMDLLAASLFALCFTNDVFTGYVFIEINTIAACSIVMARDCGQTIVATIRYLMMSLVGSGIFLFGVSMLYTITGHLLMPNLMHAVAELMENGRYHYPLAVLLGMIAVGLTVKSALYPFHSWLPTAHGSATTASSAVLSGVVLKGYIILLIKIMVRVFTMDDMKELGIGAILFVLGAVAMVYGSIWAVRETHAKRMIAYSSVAQMGYIYLGIGLCTPAGFAAAVFQIIAHAFTKPLLFVCTGKLIAVSGHQKKLYFLRGAGRRCPAAGIGFTIGGLSMVGLPMMAGFVTKLFLGRAALAEGIPLWQMIVALAAIAISSLLNAWYYLPVIFQIWKEGDAFSDKEEDRPLSLLSNAGAGISFRIAVYAMCAAVFFLGCFTVPVLRLIRQGIALL